MVSNPSVKRIRRNTEKLSDLNCRIRLLQISGTLPVIVKKKESRKSALRLFRVGGRVPHLWMGRHEVGVRGAKASMARFGMRAKGTHGCAQLLEYTKPQRL